MHKSATKDGSNSFVALLLTPFLLYAHSIPSLGGKQTRKDTTIYMVSNLDIDKNKINISWKGLIIIKVNIVSNYWWTCGMVLRQLSIT